MKTAEEWAEEWLGKDFNCESMLVQKFKQIQLDAYKQGMTDSAEIIRDKIVIKREKETGAGHFNRIVDTFIQVVLAKRDTKTTLP